MTRHKRLNRALELISERGNVSIAEISEELAISPATARRDLNSLAEQRMVTRTHGGASALGSGYELPLHYKVVRQAEAKTAIAATTLSLLEPGEVVGLNGGTTTSEVARQLGRNDRFVSRGGAPGVTLVTNALNIAYELSVREHVKIVVTGGVPRRLSYELVGPLVGSSLREFSMHTAVLGVDGLDEHGATTMHEGEAQASRDIAAAAKRVIIVADSTKMGVSTFARICDLASVDVLVTDQPLAAEHAELLVDAEIDVVVAGHE